MLNLLSCLVFFGFLLLADVRNSQAYTTIMDFGDSLSDNGNIGIFTNGLIWVERLTAHTSATLLDHAYGGATAGFDNPATTNP